MINSSKGIVGRSFSQTYRLGFFRMAEAIEKSENLFSVFQEMHLIADPAMRQELINGCVSCLVSTWICLRDSGMKVVCADTSFQPFIEGSPNRIIVDLVQSGASGKIELFKKQVSILCTAVSACKAHCKFDPAMFDKAPTENPLAVRLVSSPDRVTVQTIQRDSDQEIVSTTTREMDVVV